MANKTISDLKELSTVSDNNVLVVETNDETCKVTKENLLKGLATETFVGSEISKIELTPGPQGPKGDKGDPGPTTWEGITNKPTNLATETFVNQKIAEASFSGGDAGGDTGGGVVEETYDTEITLPFTATADTNVQLTFTPGSVSSYQLETNSNINATTSWTVNYSGADATVFEKTTYKDKQCLRYKKDETTTAYAEILSINPIGNQWDSTHKYFARVDICVISDGANSTYPAVYSSTNLNIDKTKIDQWVSYSKISTPPSYNTNEANLKVVVDGEMYFTGILVDLTLNGLETKTETELNAMYDNGEFNSANNLFSAIINNGTDSTTIEPFSDNTTTTVVNVAGGNTLSISQNGTYPLANIAAKISSSSNEGGTIEIEDVDLIINTRFRGKKAVFEGDSITDFDYSPKYENKSWATYLEKKLKLGDCYNPAVGGSSISTYNTAGSVVARVKKTNYPVDTKLFIVFAGTNDWNSNVDLGEVDSVDESTMLGALNVIIDTVQTKCPDATIVIMTPMHRSGTRTATRTSGTMMDVAKAYEEVCQRWGVDCVNTLKTFGINAYNETNNEKYLLDGLHPTPEGHKRIATRMAGIISTL